MEIPISQSDSLFNIAEKIRSCHNSEVRLVGTTNELLIKTNQVFLTEYAKKFNQSLLFEQTTQPTTKNNAKETSLVLDQEELETEKKSLSFSLKILIPIFLVFLSLVALFAMWWFVPKAKVNVVLNSEVLVKNIEVTVDPKASGVDITNKIIPGVELAVVKSERKTTPTTGKITIGEKARGNVTITNKTTNDKSFDAGTLLVLENDDKKKYVLTEDVEISKKTTTETPRTDGVAGVITTETFGTKETKIEAVEVGAQYNLDKNTVFLIDDEKKENILVTNDKEKIDKGESHEVKAIAKEDIDTVVSLMDNSIKSSATDAIREKLVGDQVIPDGATSIATIEQTFDKKIGDQADILVLDQTVEATVTVYAKSHLKEIVSPILKATIPDKFSLYETDSQLEISDGIFLSYIESAGPKKMNLQVKVKSFIIPKLDTEKTLNDITGQSVASVENYLDNLPGLASYQMEVWPPLPTFARTLPHVTSRIILTVGHK